VNERGERNKSDMPADMPEPIALLEIYEKVSVLAKGIPGENILDLPAAVL
jgi:hypothetical protein